jgi:hypothetical protein
MHLATAPGTADVSGSGDSFGFCAVGRLPGPLALQSEPLRQSLLRDDRTSYPARPAWLWQWTPLPNQAGASRLGVEAVWNFFARRATEGNLALSRHSVTSAMTPYIWTAGVVSPTCFGAGYFLRESPVACWFLLVLGSLPVLTVCGMSIYFGLRDPDRLHSEEYRLRSRALQITETKGGKFLVNPVDMATIANPYPTPKQLGHRPSAPDANPETQGGADHA